MKNYMNLQNELKQNPRVRLVTGVAGFIGSNLLEALLKAEKVIGLDNFSTDTERDWDEVRPAITGSQLANFTFIQGDIRNYSGCTRACAGVDYILHHAALCSVPCPSLQKSSPPRSFVRSHHTGKPRAGAVTITSV